MLQTLRSAMLRTTREQRAHSHGGSNGEVAVEEEERRLGADRGTQLQQPIFGMAGIGGR